MKHSMFLFALLLGLAACAPVAAIPTRTAAPATATPVPSRTATPMPTETGTPTASPTPLASPTPELPPYFAGLAKTLDQIPDMGSIDKLIVLAQYYAAQPPLVTAKFLPTFAPQDLPDSTIVTIYCNYDGHMECAVLATVRVGDHLYAIMQIMTKAGPRNLLLYLSGPSTAFEKDDAQLFLGRLNSGKGFQLEIFLRLKVSDLPNPEINKIYKPDPNSTVSLSGSSMNLENGIIDDEMQTILIWGKVQ